jgi:hypothetical protein
VIDLYPFLGKAEWGNDSFPPYHPVLMVAGFYFSQILGINMWSLIPNHGVAKLFHAAFMLGSVATMIAALYAVFDYESYFNLVNLTSMHAWVGVMTIIIFVFQIVGGFIMGLMTAYGNRSPAFKNMHRAMGLILLACTTVSIISGIQDQLSGPKAYEYGTQVVCNYGYCYSVGGGEVKITGSCGDMPAACYIAFFTGFFVMLGSICTGLAVSSRSANAADQKGTAPASSDYNYPNSNVARTVGGESNFHYNSAPAPASAPVAVAYPSSYVVPSSATPAYPQHDTSRPQYELVQRTFQG